MSIDVGPFRLIRPIGKGGMGVVWHGVHYDTGVPVAVKVITQRVSRDERTLQAFRNEVRAVAGLDHPGIVWVLDYGEISHEASVASERQLTEGSPYLVMEMATGGTLSAYRDGLPWSELRVMLLALLDSLAHAHARGVIHRDLKPGNVLLCGPNDLRPGLKLTDFGIAHAREETVSDSMSNHVIGTLHYMAPEQIRADWRDYGPWTDLYSLGTIAYRLITGELPYQGKRGASLMVAQLNHRPPSLSPVHPMPDGLEDWLHTMLRKEHERRFQCAADAALALRALPERVVGAGSVGLAPVRLGAGFGLDDEPHTLELLDDGGTTGSSMPSPARLRAPGPAREELDRTRPRLPHTWRRPRTEDAGVVQMRGAGLGLFGLRAPRLVGREHERDVLWKNLREVVATAQPRVVIVRGDKGTGKTALVRWIAERAVETGAAHLLRCDFGSEGQPLDGLRLMLRRFFRVARLGPEERARRVLDVLDTFGETDEAEAARLERLLDAVDPAVTDGGERHAVLRWFFGRLASDRPLILWLEDAQFGMDGLQLVHSLLRASASRVLAVVAVEDQALDGRRFERAYVERIASSSRARTLTVGPLATESLEAYVREDLGLAPALAADVARRAGGVPQFAVQLVGDWIERDLLRRSPDGYVLPAGTAMPRTMGQVWTERIEQLLADLPGTARSMLERAAVLGEDVDDREWGIACDDPEGRMQAAGGAPLHPERLRLRAVLVDRLLARRLALEAEGGWTFAEAELRATLVEQASRAGRKRSHHLAIARVLRGDGAASERLGHHLVHAGLLDEGTDALINGIRARLAAAGTRPAQALLERTREVLEDAGVQPDDPRWGAVGCLEAEIALQRGRLDAAEATARALLQGDGEGWSAHHVQAHLVLGIVGLLRKQPDAARQAYARFERLAAPGELLVSRAAVAHGRSLLAEVDGDGTRARRRAGEAAELLESAGATLQDVWRLHGARGLIAARAGALVANLERRAALYERPGQEEGLAECWAMLGVAMRRAQQRSLAERCLTHAARLFELVDSAGAYRTRLQLATLKASRGDFEGAEQDALRVANAVRDAHRKPVLLHAHALLGLCAAGRERWTLFGDHLDAIERLIADTGAAERELGWLLARSAEAAIKARRAGLASRTASLARDQLARAGDVKQQAAAARLVELAGRLG